jgi:predicted site-specific integrase-resolvase
MPDSTFLLVGDAARRVGKSSETIRVWIRSGRLKAERTPNGIHVIRPADLATAADPKRSNGDAAA